MEGTDERDARSATAEKAIDMLIKIGERTTLFHDDDGTAYAGVSTEVGGFRVMAVNGKDFRLWLNRVFYEENGKPPKTSSVVEACATLEARARYDGEQHRLSSRFAQRDSEVWIDLVDSTGRGIHVSPEGWSIEPAPLMFRRFGHQSPLPVPCDTSDTSDALKLKHFLHLPSEEDLCLVLCWMTVAALANTARPLLVLHGPAGSGKTVAARVLRDLLDPSSTPAIHANGRDTELAQILSHHAMPIFDNLPVLNDWKSNMLCTAVTGGGFSKRSLYSDEEDTTFSYKQAILLTGITIPATAPDLLDRSLLVHLNRVPDYERRTEDELLEAFRQARPAILGALLSALSRALGNAHRFRKRALPRMADFAAYGAAAADALGFGADMFFKAYERNIQNQIWEVIDGSLLAKAVVDFARTLGSRTWRGSATHLLEVLDKFRDGTSATDWPRSPDSLGKRLRSLEATLLEAGVRLIWSYDTDRNRGRIIELSWVGDRASRPASGTQRQDANVSEAADVSSQDQSQETSSDEGDEGHEEEESPDIDSYRSGDAGEVRIGNHELPPAIIGSELHDFCVCSACEQAFVIDGPLSQCKACGSATLWTFDAILARYRISGDDREVLFCALFLANRDDTTWRRCLTGLAEEVAEGDLALDEDFIEHGVRLARGIRNHTRWAAIVGDVVTH